MVGSTGIAGRPGDAPFANTGPQGHRGRMRARLLANGPDGLADYELVEMLLFLSIPRRDTKPLAKALINRFGAMHDLLAAPEAELRLAGLDPATGGVFDLVNEAARRLAQAEARSRPLLNDMSRLVDYLDVPARLRRAPHLAVLLLNNRNQMLAEMLCTGHQHAPDIARSVAERAIHIHATALILATFRSGAPPDPAERDLEVTGCVARAAKILSITVHDHWSFGDGETISLKRMGLL